jgi:adenosylhomocysteinase
MAPRARRPPASRVADPALAEQGRARIAWADAQMPVLRQVRERFVGERPLAGRRVAACLHVTAETAALVHALLAGGAHVALCAANPLSTRDDVVVARRGERAAEARAGLDALVAWRPELTLDDGADLVIALHAAGGGALEPYIGGLEETTTGLVRLRALAAADGLLRPVLAVNEARSERVFNDRYGTGQSALDGIVRATNMLVAGRTIVVFGYGWTGRGVAQRARGAGAVVVVCEIDPLRALEARMEGFEVMPAVEAAPRGDVFITVTGVRDVLRGEHFERMKDGAVLANAGHFDVEISLSELRAIAAQPPAEVIPLVEEYRLADGRRLHLLAGGRVVNLAAGEGHPAEVMDISFAGQALAVEHLARAGGGLAPGVQPVPDGIDLEVARLKLEALGVRIDALSADQLAYREGWAPA